MAWFRGRIPYISVLLAIGTLVTWLVWRAPAKQISYGPVLPRVSDSAVFEVSVREPGIPLERPDGTIRGRRESDYRTIRILLKCVRSNGQVCTFQAYYLNNGASAKPAYTVEVDYSTNDMVKRMAVRDSTGRVVPMGSRIDGNPVPFDCFAAFDKDYLGQGERIIDSPKGPSVFIMRWHSPSSEMWQTEYQARGGSREAPQESLSRYQRWRVGEWIWVTSWGYDPEWSAKRISYTSAGASPH